MGSPSSSRAYTQWSKGEYPSANNTEDDLSAIVNRTGLASDVSSSTTNAPLVASGITITTADEAISSATDVDVYAVDVAGGSLAVTLGRSLRTNLAPRVTVTGPGGTIADVTPSLASPNLSSLSTTILPATSVPNGRYHVTVRGVAATNGDFTSYGSAGWYNLTLVRPNPPSTPTVTLTATGSRVMTASWPASTGGTGAISYDVAVCADGGACGATTTLSTTSIVTTAPFDSGKVRVRVTARDQSGQTSGVGESAAVDVLTAPVPPALQRLQYDADTGQISVTYGGGAEFAPVTVTSRMLTVRNRATNATVQLPLVGGAGSVTVNVPGDWGQQWADVWIAVGTGYPSPWQSVTGASSEVFLGRPGVPSAAPGAGGTRQPTPAGGTGGSGGRTPSPAS